MLIGCQNFPCYRGNRNASRDKRAKSSLISKKRCTVHHILIFFEVSLQDKISFAEQIANCSKITP